MLNSRLTKIVDNKLILNQFNYLNYFLTLHQLLNIDQNYYLFKEFKFSNFLESQKFINKVGDLSEEEGHHPDIFFGWGYAKITIFTHAIKGLAESDFILAAKIDKI